MTELFKHSHLGISNERRKGQARHLGESIACALPECQGESWKVL